MVQDIIQLFGGISKLSDILKIPKQTISGWKRNNNIPHWRVDAIKSAATAHNIDLTNYFNGGNNAS